jgi:hypothetical protein
MATQIRRGVVIGSLSFCVLLGIHVVILGGNIRRSFPNVDETAHLPSGLAHWEFGTFEYYRVNPPLIRLLCCFPAWLRGDSFTYGWPTEALPTRFRPEFIVAKSHLTRNRLGIQRQFLLPRLVAVGISLTFLLLIVAYFQNSLGRSAAMAFAGFWAFSPGVLAHAGTIGPDIGATLVGLAMCMVLHDYSRQRSFWTAVVLGLVFGLALLSKLTWLTGFVSLPLTLFVLGVLGFLSPEPHRSLLIARDLVVAATIAIFVVNLGYLFEGTLKPLGEFRFLSASLSGLVMDKTSSGNRFSDEIFGSCPVPFPENYILGIDYLRYEVETKMWSFLNGEWKFGSWPFYYIMTTLYKTPEPTLLAALIGLGVLITGIRQRIVKPEVISMFLFLIIPAAVCFASVSLQGGFNHHHRYVLMIYPPMFALAAYIASPVGIKLLRFRLPLFGPTKRSIAVPLAITLVTLSAVSSLSVHPYYISYFNTLSGGPENGWRLLGFSNIDWGQDILEVDKWLKQHPDRRPLVMDIDYFDMNGNLFDVPTSDPPQLPKDASIDEVRKSITETQWWIISVKKLYNFPSHDGLEYLQQIEPVDKIAYAYHVYRIDPLPSGGVSPDLRVGPEMPSQSQQSKSGDPTPDNTNRNPLPVRLHGNGRRAQ